MENLSALVDSTGKIRKHELVRVIVESLHSLGYKRSASCLESESGVLYKSEDFELLRSQVLDGDWNGCVKTISSVKNLTEDGRSSALFAVFKHCIQKYVNRGDDSSALDFLRNKVSVSGLGAEKVHKLASCILFGEERVSGELCTKSSHDQRDKLLMELERVFPPLTTIPERRLEHLVETALVAQLASCTYHNSLNTVSLYKDHYCSRDQFPTETIQILSAHKNEVWCVQFSNNGNYLASSSRDRTTIIWKVLEDGKMSLMHTLQGHKSAVSFVSWSPDDTMLLTCGNLEVLKLWDVEAGTCKHTFGGSNFIISSCAWFPNSKRLVCGSTDPERGICLLSTNGKEIKVWKGSRLPKIVDMAITPDGKNLVNVFTSHEIRVFNFETTTEHVIQEEHPVTSLSISRDSKFLIVNLNSQGIHLWDIDGELQNPLRYVGHEQEKYVIRSCFGGYDDSFIASGSENCKVYIWNRKNPVPIEVLSGHRKTVNCVAWNPKRHQILASASDDHTVRIWGPSLLKNLID